ncbi:MAG: hypothetical protein LBG58_00600 [Planctomycetaceae bacterium]|jgi:hypothetical protein|nr:hypothetical protein [Planctomycetaceae bacterium]
MTSADTKTNSSNPSPYSTSGGGYCYENFVQSSFVLSMLAENNVHTFPNSVITKIALQGRYANYATDDCILFLRDTNTNVEHKFLLSIKKTINITKSCNDFKDSLFHAWVDFNETTFNKNFDHIGLVTSFLTKTDNENVKTFLQWAKHCDSAEEFYQKIDHNRNKKEKYDVFHELLIASNNNQPIRPELLWQFLKS